MLDPTFFDRFTMGFSLAVHISLVVVGLTIPLIIMLAEYLGIKYNDKYYLTLSRRLTTAFVVLFAVGTASGLLVATELLFLWPSFMALVGQTAILPVFCEVFAFFCESIFLALYVFSHKAFGHTYKRVAIMGIVTIGAALSAVFITMLNAFMNTPVGFNIPAYLSSGIVQVTSPLAVFNSPAAGIEIFHVLATSYFVGLALFLAYFSYRYLKSKTDNEKTYYQKAMKLVFALTCIAVVFAIITGITSIEQLYHVQPEKYAAIELNLVSQSDAPEVLGGIDVNNTIQYGLAIPGLQSILATGNTSGVVPGLNQYPQNTWPPLIVHYMFDFMVVLGFLLGLIFALIFVMHLLKKKPLENRKVGWLFILCGFAAWVLLENGWMVDEFGRQPWIIYNVMTVAQAGNLSPTIIPLAIAIILLYAFIIPATILVLRKIFSDRPLEKELR
jgi:cytochrome bd ubiquinol oxidase subunit I